MRTSRSGLAVVAALLASPGCAWGWGPNGHRIVGEIAERHLSEQARREIAVILDGDGLSEVSTWPDEIRSEPAWKHADVWHYLSIDDGETLATTARDPKGDVLEALQRFEAVLRDRQAPREKKAEALRFYVHFAGDVHQPLHVGRRADRGGNEIRVKWFRQPSNLHSVWDHGLIESQSLSFTEFVRFIDDRTPRQVAAWRAAPYAEWVRESFCLRGAVYDFGRETPADPALEPELGYGYAFAKMGIVEERLVKAGVRLAARLDAIFAG
ncbi:MAG: S1/P1 nuclease, partial [Thermoanaerobaculia bacterium]